MTLATEPTFFDPLDVPTFALHDGAGVELLRLYPTFNPPDELGEPDPYEWDRPPGSGAWFPLGDGLPRQRPTFRLTTERLYDSVNDALTDIAALQAAIQDARELWWRGEKLDDLDERFPGSYRFQYLGIAQHVRHTLTLNTGKAITAANLGGQGSTPLSQALPYIWPEVGDPETYSAVQTIDLQAKLGGKPTRSGVIENLGDAEFTVILWQGTVQHAPLVVLPQTSRELMAGLTKVTLTPAEGSEMRPQLEVQ